MSVQNITKTLVISLSLSVATGSLALAQSSPASIVEGWVSAAQGYDFVKVTHNGINHDASSNITTIRGLSIQFSVDGATMQAQLGEQTAKTKGKLDYKITFPSISFDSLSLDNGYYSARSIHADIANLDFGITGSPPNNSSSTAVYKNFNFNNIKWARLPEVVEAPGKPVSKYYPLVEAMVDFSFDNAGIDGMTMHQSYGDSEITMDMTYGPSSVGSTVRGNISEIIIDGMTMAMRSPKGAGNKDVNITFGPMTAYGYDYGTLVRNFAPGITAKSANEPFTSIIGEFLMKDIKVEGKDGVFSMDNLTVSDIGVRPARIDILKEADELFLAAKSGGEEPDSKKIIELLGSTYGTLRLGNFEMAGMKFGAPDAGKGKMDLYRINDLSANGLGEFALKGINFSGVKGEYFNMDQFSLSNVTFPALEALMNIEEAKKKNDILAIMKAIPTFGLYMVRGLEVRVPGEGDFSLAEGSLEMSGFIGPVPTKVDLSVTDAKMPVKIMDREPRALFSAMGFTDIEFSYAISALWQEASRVLSLNATAGLTDAGALNADVAVGGIPRSVFENPMTAQSLIALVTVNSANILFDDQSIVDKALAVAAAKQGVDPATLKAQAVGMLPFMLGVLNKPEFVNQVTEAVKTFLDTKGRIAVSATPATPVSVLQLMAVGSSAPGAIIDMLNVKIAAE